MTLPFTHDQFFEVFAAYNHALWPGAVLLWIASLASCALLLQGRPVNRTLSAILAVHWAWSAIGYHALFFTGINPGAWLFAGLFLLEAALITWHGLLRGRLTFAPGRGLWARIAWVLLAYALLYPAIGLVQGYRFPHMPTFGVPCPTTIFTAGLLMLATPRPPWTLVVIPILWSIVGGSAAFVFGVRADLALPVAGIALAISVARRRSL